MASRNTPGVNSPYLTKQQRQQQAREKTRLLQQAEVERVRRIHLFVALGGSFTIILIVAAVTFVIRNSTKEEEVKPETNPSANVSTDGVISVGKSSSEGTTRAGARNVGGPRVRIYFDYVCTRRNDPRREYGNKPVNLAGRDEITPEIVPLSVLQQKFSDVASQANYYIAKKAPQYYVAFHTRYFANVSAPIFARKKSVPSESQHRKITFDVARKVGVPDNVLKGLNSALSGNRYTSFLQHVAKKFADTGHQGTPTVTINGKRLEGWTEGKLLTEFEKVIGHRLEASGAELTTPKGR